MKIVYVLEEEHYEGNSARVFSTLKKARMALAKELASVWSDIMRYHSNSPNPRDREFEEWGYHGDIPIDADKDWFFNVLHNTKHCAGCNCDTDSVVFSNCEYHAIAIRDMQVE
jgi:hypothetical protein